MAMIRILTLLVLGVSVLNGAVSFNTTANQCTHLGPDKFSITGPLGLVTNALSVSFWVEKKAGNPNGSVYLGWGRTVGNNDVFDIEDSNGAFCLNYADPTPAYHTFTVSSTTPQTNVPIHIGLRFASGDSNTAQFFINGSRATATWVGGASNLKLTPYSGEPLRIGCNTGTSGTRSRISEVAIWNCMLSDQEFLVLSRTRKRGTPLQIRRKPTECLVIYVPLDGEFPYGSVGSGTNMVKDFGPNNFNMTPLNSPIWSIPWLSSP